MTDTTSDTSPPVLRRRPGRPRGAKNKPKVEGAEIFASGLAPLMITEATLCQLLGISPTTAKDLARRQEIDVIYDGRRDESQPVNLVLPGFQQMLQQNSTVVNTPSSPPATTTSWR